MNRLLALILPARAFDWGVLTQRWPFATGGYIPPGGPVWDAATNPDLPPGVVELRSGDVWHRYPLIEFEDDDQ